MTSLKIRRNLSKVARQYHALLNASIDRMEVVIQSIEFEDALREVIAKSNGLEGELSSWKKKSAIEIYKQLLECFERFGLTLETYYTPKRVIGFGYESDTIIRLNTKYLSTYSVDDPADLKAVGSNLTHEAGHDCGFDHDFAATARRKNSIAYLLNEAYEIAYDRIYPPKKAPPVYVKPWYKRIFSWL